MMPKLILGLLAGAALTLGVSTAAVADTGPIAAREACMKANGKMLKAIIPVLKGKKPYDKAAIDAAMGTAEKACAGWDGWWGEDTKAGNGVETEAKDEIWSDKAGFDAAAAAYVKAFGTVKATADAASLKAAFPALGMACKNCHEKFRKPDEDD